MRFRFLPAVFPVIALFCALALADDPPRQPEMTSQTRMELIRAFNAELVYSRTTFPIGSKGLALKDGKISPNGKDMDQLLALWGPAIKPGDQMMITAVHVEKNRIHFEINGGPIKKKKWYQHIQLDVGGAGVQAPDDPHANLHGSFVNLVFDGYVPEVSAQQLKEILRPVFDFDAKSAVEAYLETVPPKVKEAIQNHAVLVGMNREMVTYSLGRPPHKTREKDGDVDYEEWIYGEPPKDVQFVRLVGDEVVRVEIMKVSGEKTIRTEKEVDLGTESASVKDKEAPKERPANAPSLRRPGEANDQGASNPSTATPDRHGPVRPLPPTQDPGDTVPHYVAL
jgi:hypothetical protein